MDERESSILVCQHPFEAILGVLGQSRGLDRLEQVRVLLLDGVIPDSVPGLIGIRTQGEILPNPEENFGVHIIRPWSMEENHA